MLKRGVPGGIDKILIKRKIDKQYLLKTLGKEITTVNSPPMSNNVEKLKAKVSLILNNSIISIVKERDDLRNKINSINKAKNKIVKLTTSLLGLCKILNIKVVR